MRAGLVWVAGWYFGRLIRRCASTWCATASSPVTPRTAYGSRPATAFWWRGAVPTTTADTASASITTIPPSVSRHDWSRWSAIAVGGTTAALRWATSTPQILSHRYGGTEILTC